MKLEAQSKKNVVLDMGKALREELLSTIIKVRFSVSASLYVYYSSRHKWMRGKTPFREVSYLGFYLPDGF
jgi:hypothetical protein